MRWVHNLEFADDGPRAGAECVVTGQNRAARLPPFEAPVCSLHLLPGEAALLVGLESGAYRRIQQVRVDGS